MSQIPRKVYTRRVSCLAAQYGGVRRTQSGHLIITTGVKMTGGHEAVVHRHLKSLHDKIPQLRASQSHQKDIGNYLVWENIEDSITGVQTAIEMLEDRT